MATSRPVAVTGATGFIGTRLCEQLLDNGFAVRALVRNPRLAGKLSQLGVELVAGDLHEPSALQALVDGATSVVHCAGAVRGSSLADFAHTNVEGTKNLVSAVSKHSQDARFLLLSSLAAREPQLSWYAQSKRGAEQTVQETTALDWCIIRPPPVYGPGDREMKAIFDWMARGIALVPGNPESRLSLIHVDDLVDACITCLQAPQLDQALYTVCDGKHAGYDWFELAAIAEQVWQRKVRLYTPPQGLLNAVAACNLALARAIGRAPMLTPPKLRELRHPDWVVDNRAINTALDWQPEIGLLEGLQRLDKAAL
ncbi:MAG: SDR family NAD(P)-dependent oxidoreductase [Halieaceae bacterium]